MALEVLFKVSVPDAEYPAVVFSIFVDLKRIRGYFSVLSHCSSLRKCEFRNQMPLLTVLASILAVMELFDRSFSSN